MASLALPLFDLCPCGEREVAKAGLCKSCYDRRWRSLAHFEGRRETVLERDGHACRVCGSSRHLNVHHRNGSNRLEDLITLCAGCHTRVHRLMFNRRWLPEMLVHLWRERHPDGPIQLQLELAA